MVWAPTEDSCLNHYYIGSYKLMIFLILFFLLCLLAGIFLYKRLAPHLLGVWSADSPWLAAHPGPASAAESCLVQGHTLPHVAHIQ